MLNDRMRNEAIRLALEIEQTTDPIEKQRLMRKGRALLAASQSVKRNNAIEKINRLKQLIPKVYRDQPHALKAIKEKQEGHEKFIPFLPELKKGQTITDEIRKLAVHNNIELSEPRKSKQTTTTRRNKKGKKERNVRTSKTFCQRKFDTLKSLNNAIDDKDQPMELRRMFTKGKRMLVSRETEFNGTRRNDSLSNNRQSWNPDSEKLAGAKGAR